MGNIGEASLQLTVNTAAFIGELRQALEIAYATLKGTPFEFPMPDTSKAKSGLEGVGDSAKEAGEKVEQLGEHWTSMIEKMAKFEVIKGIIDGVSNAFSNVSNYVMGFVKDFGIAEQSSAKLQNNLNNLGQGDYFSKLTQQASELSKITPFDDDDIINAQAMLGTFKLAGPEIEKLTPRLLDLTAAYQQNGQAGMNLQQVAVMIGKSAGTEMVTNLQRVGVVMTEVEKETLKTATGMEKMNILSKILDNNFKGLGETLGKTTLGQLQIAENQFKNIREQIGEKFAPVVLTITNALTKLGEIFSGLPDTMQVVIVAIGGVGTALAALIPILVALDVASGGTLIAVGLILTALAGLGAVIAVNMDGIKAWVTQMLGGEEGLNRLKEAGQFLIDKFNEVYDFIANTLSGAFEQIRTVVETVIHQFTGAGDSSGKLVDAMKKLVSDGIEIVKTHIQNLTNLVITIIKEYGNFIQQHPGLVSALKNVAEFGFAVVSTAVKIAIGLLEFFITTATRAVTAISGIVQAFEGLAKLNLVDAIFNPEKLEAGFQQVRDGMNKLKEAFTVSAKGSTQTTGEQSEVPKVEEKVKTTISKETGSTGKGKTEGKSSDDVEKEIKQTVEKVKDDSAELLKIQERINALVGDIDAFIILRSSKQLKGVEKDAAEIEKIYKAMYDKIEKSELGDGDKQLQKARLEVAQQQELSASKVKFEKQAEQEVATLKLKNEGNDYKIKVKNIQDKYAKEKERIFATYTEGVTRTQLLRQLDLARVNEVNAVQTTAQQTLFSVIQGGWQSVMGALNSGFASLWESVFGQANSLFEQFVQTVIAKLFEIAASKLFTMIIDVVSGGAFGALGGLFRASGGPVSSGGSYIVGEEGPEIFTPERDGNILPNSDYNEMIANLNSRLANVDRVNIPSFDIPQMQLQGGGSTVIVNIDGKQIINHKSIKGMTNQDWNTLVDDEIAPQLSAHLRRTGKKVIDDTIKV